MVRLEKTARKGTTAARWPVVYTTFWSGKPLESPLYTELRQLKDIQKFDRHCPPYAEACLLRDIGGPGLDSIPSTVAAQTGVSVLLDPWDPRQLQLELYSHAISKNLSSEIATLAFGLDVRCNPEDCSLDSEGKLRREKAPLFITPVTGRRANGVVSAVRLLKPFNFHEKRQQPKRRAQEVCYCEKPPKLPKKKNAAFADISVGTHVAYLAGDHDGFEFQFSDQLLWLGEVVGVSAAKLKIKWYTVNVEEETATPSETTNLMGKRGLLYKFEADGDVFQAFARCVKAQQT